MILLSFDTEEFDVPKEHGVDFTLEEGMKISIYGANIILDILKDNNVKGTFFCTANFAENAPAVMRRIVDEGHEVACHGCDHWRPQASDFIESKRRVEAATGIKCNGYRQPRMFPVNDNDIREAGYLYNSSLNPAFIPGRYMHLSTPRTFFMKNGVLQIPASVTPIFRIPLFWLALHNFPEWLYRSFVKRVLSHDGYFTTYFHPWEFYDLKSHPEFKMPFIIKNHCGEELQKRLDSFIKEMKSSGEAFSTYTAFIKGQIKNNL